MGDQRSAGKKNMECIESQKDIVGRTDVSHVMREQQSNADIANMLIVYFAVQILSSMQVECERDVKEVRLPPLERLQTTEQQEPNHSKPSMYPVSIHT